MIIIGFVQNIKTILTTIVLSKIIKYFFFLNLKTGWNVSYGVYIKIN
jgi:hypothetical protein